MPGVAGNIGEWYYKADVYVMTSLYEGFGNTLAESLAYGVPAVSVDCEAGPREIIRNNIDGLLVPQDDSDALVSALNNIMGDEDLRLRFSKKAIDARERFAVEKIAGKWEALFTDLLNS
jgi:glycosyltransferase involved in cell wall biosynthesis